VLLVALLNYGQVASERGKDSGRNRGGR
jgi:hypothetical protein